ncbi:MAG: hypothetical protein R3B40_24530 [Polyangiales bacterium]
MRSIRLRPEAELDVVEAVIWYETERDGLGLRFEEQLDAVLRFVAEAPAQFPLFHRRVRRALVPSFPFGVLFVDQAEEVIVIGVLHLHSDPDAWAQRAGRS